MELENRTGFAQKSMETPEQNFTIRASAKAFQILSSQLYTNKPRAIIRELLCNAWDAHTVSGNAYNTIQLQLPNTLQPTFSIRDYGTGISSEDIIHVYTKYFESTKTHSNDYIGGLGLGSKTPFCYTDNFIVNSYYGGKKYSYACILNEEGMPAINLIDCEETKEPNGLEVSFAVKQADHAVFKKEAEFVLFWFAVQPTVTGVSLSIKEMDALISGTDWRIVQEKRTNSNSYYYHYDNETSIRGAWILMGNVAYRLDKQAFSQINAEQSAILELDIHIQCPIGSVEIAASREQLSLNKPTINYIKKRLSEIAIEARSSFEKELDACPNMWEATLTKCEKLATLNGSLQKIIAATTVQYKGKSLVNRLESSLTSFTVFDRETNSSGDVISRKSADRNIFPGRNVVFVKVEPDWKENKVRSWCRRNDKDFTKVVILETDSQKKIAEDAGISKDYLFNFEELPEPVKVVGARAASTGKKKGDVYIYEFNADYPRKFTSISSVDFEDEDGEYVYVKARYKEPEISGNLVSLHSLQSGIAVFNSYWKSSKIDKLYGLTESQIELVKSSDNWINLEDYISTRVNKLLNKKEYFNFLVADFLRRQNIKNSLLLFLDNRVLTEIRLSLDASHPINAFFLDVDAKVVEITTLVKSNSFETERQLLGNYDIQRIVSSLQESRRELHNLVETESSKIIREFSNREEALFKDYPILSLFATPRTVVYSPQDLAKLLRKVF